VLGKQTWCERYSWYQQDAYANFRPTPVRTNKRRCAHLLKGITVGTYLLDSLSLKEEERQNVKDMTTFNTSAEGCVVKIGTLGTKKGRCNSHRQKTKAKSLATGGISYRRTLKNPSH